MNVLVAGGGVAGLETVLALQALAGERVRITLLSRDGDFVYPPLSVGEPFALGNARRIAITDFAAEREIDVRNQGLASVDAGRQTVELDDGGRLSYDKLIVATGARRKPAFTHALTFRGHEDTAAFHGLVRDVEHGSLRSIAFVVPSGVAWSLPLYELALMTSTRARELSIELDITFVTPEERPLAGFGPVASADVQRLLDQAGITTHCSRSTAIPIKTMLVLHPGGEQIDCQRIVALPTIEGRPVPGLPTDANGFLPIDGHGCVRGTPNVYAAGDGTDFPLKQGGVACQQADAVAEHIAREAGIPLDAHTFRPVLRGKLMTGGQPHYLVHDVSGMTGTTDQSGGDVLWWPPTKVAGRYLAPYLASRGSDAASRAFVGPRATA